MTRRSTGAAASAASAAPAASAGRGRKRSAAAAAPAAAAAAAHSDNGSAGDEDEEAAFEAAAGRRSYNALGYWDERYKRHFANQTGADGEGEAAAAGERANKRAKAGAAPPSALMAPSGDDVTSDDITSEWYYSWADLAPMLQRALRGVDRSKNVLDIGCGISQVFEDLQRGGSQEWKKKKDESMAKKTKGAAAAAAADDAAAALPGPAFEGEMIGVDYSPSVVAHLRQAYPTEQHPKLHWICADACYLIEDAPAQSEAKGKSKGSKSKGKGKAAAESVDDVAAATASSAGPPPLSVADRARFFRPGSFSLILDKATSDGMLCSDATAELTELMYRNVARLLAPGGLFVVASVNEPESGWFGELVVSSLLEYGGEDVRWDIEAHIPSAYTDGEQGAPNVYVICKTPLRAAARSNTKEGREGYTIKRFDY